jgi:hypothetical protein
VLRTVDGEPLPTVIDSATGAAIQLFDTLTFDIATDTAHEVSLAVESVSEGNPATIVVGLKGIYSLSGDSIRIRYLLVCPPTCVPNKRGRIQNTLMTLTPDIDGGLGSEYVYERVH